jgi:hypothetical protein
LIALLAALCLPGMASGQRASVLLPADHWSRVLVRRAVLLDSTSIARVSRTWPATYQDLAQLSGEDTARLLIETSLGYEAREDALRAGTSSAVPGGYAYSGPRNYPDRNTLVTQVTAGLRLTPALVVGVDAIANSEGTSLRAAYMVGSWRTLTGWIGRRPIGFSSGPADGIVLNQRTPFTGGGVSLSDGVRVPVLGQLYADASLARLHRNGAVRHPWFQAMRITIAPHPDFAIGLNRAAIFGGEGDNSITPARIALMFLGFPDVAGKDSDFENQVASIDVLARGRIGATPIVMQAEYGTDDTGFAFLHVPAVIAGVEIPSLPRFNRIGAGVEAIFFTESCCSYPEWYRHGALGDGWSDRGRLLGHPLGGAGRELGLTVNWVRARAQPLIGLRAFARNRSRENLFAPDRLGESAGAQLTVVAVMRRYHFELKADGEAGHGWQSSGVRVLGAYRFGAR